MSPAGAAPETINYMFGGFLAGFLLIAVWVGRLAFRLGALSRRMDRLNSPDSGA